MSSVLWYEITNIKAFKKFLLTQDFKLPTGQINNIKKHKTLVLDLDKTLIHNAANPCQTHFSFSFPVKKTEYHVCIRAGVIEFLKQMREYYKNIVIFTAAYAAYADPICQQISKLVGDCELFSTVLTKKDCDWPSYKKNLSCIEGVDSLKDVVLVDDRYMNCSYHQTDNLLCFPPFECEGDSLHSTNIQTVSNEKRHEDECIIFESSIGLLAYLSQVEDVRIEISVLKSQWKKHGIIQSYP